MDTWALIAFSIFVRVGPVEDSATRSGPFTVPACFSGAECGAPVGTQLLPA